MMERLGGPPLKPVDSWRFCYDFNFCPGFLKECAGFKRALPSSHHEDTLSGELPEVMVLRGVRGKRRGEVVKFGRSPRERANSCGDNHAPRPEDFTIFEVQTESSGISFNPSDLPLVNVWYRMMLEPSPILNELIQRYGSGKAMAGCCLECFQRQHALRVRDLSRSPIGAKKHAHRHVSLPKGHRLAEHPKFHALYHA
jgi:hypothetical protein